LRDGGGLPDLLVRLGRIPSSSRPTLDRRNAPRRRPLFAAAATAASLSLLGVRIPLRHRHASGRTLRLRRDQRRSAWYPAGRRRLGCRSLEGHLCKRRPGDHRERDCTDARGSGPGPARPRRQALAQHLGAEHARQLYRRRNGRRSGRQDGHGTEHVPNARSGSHLRHPHPPGVRKTYGVGMPVILTFSRPIIPLAHTRKGKVPVLLLPGATWSGAHGMPPAVHPGRGRRGARGGPVSKDRAAGLVGEPAHR
jgi:hypothetical protein